MRMVCTDQLGITHPAAVQRAISSGIQIRNFADDVVYHPKVYLAHDRNDRPIRFLLGSAKARDVLANPAAASGKQQSELKLLGFMHGGSLTELGRAAAALKSDEAVARLWCGWLQQTPDEQLKSINEKLLVAKRVFPQFWRLKEDVRKEFLANAQSPRERRTLQTIELLCNARDVVQELSLDDMRTLSKLLGQPERVPEYIRDEVAEYFGNKGTRSWDTADRRVMPEAWRDAVIRD